MAEEDPRKEPQYRERVPYVVIRDSSKPRIKDRCVTPEDFIKSYETNLPVSLDYEYYITRVLIPPLERIFNLIGIDITGWYRQMPIVMRGSHVAYAEGCLVCGNRLDDSANICLKCLANEQEVIADIILTSRDTEKKLVEVERVCQSVWIITPLCQWGDSSINALMIVSMEIVSSIIINLSSIMNRNKFSPKRQNPSRVGLVI